MWTYYSGALARVRGGEIGGGVAVGCGCCRHAHRLNKWKRSLPSWSGQAGKTDRACVWARSCSTLGKGDECLHGRCAVV